MRHLYALQCAKHCGRGSDLNMVQPSAGETGQKAQGAKHSLSRSISLTADAHACIDWVPYPWMCINRFRDI